MGVTAPECFGIFIANNYLEWAYTLQVGLDCGL